MPSPPSLQVLSTELLHRIGDCLDDQDLAHLARVNRLFRLVFAQPLVKRSREDKPSIVMLSVMQVIGQHHPGVNMNKADRFIVKHHHRTPLQIAIKSRNLAMLEFLINQEVKMTEDEVVLVDAILVDELLS